MHPETQISHQNMKLQGSKPEANRYYQGIALHIHKHGFTNLELDPEVLPKNPSTELLKPVSQHMTY